MTDFGSEQDSTSICMRVFVSQSGRTALHDAVFDNRTPAVAALAQEVPDIMWKVGTCRVPEVSAVSAVSAVLC